MEESIGFQDLMQANCAYEGQHSSQPRGPNQPLQGQTLSQPMVQNQPCQCKHLSQPMSPTQPFQRQPMSQSISQNLPFHSQSPSQPMGQNQPFQGHLLSQSMVTNQLFQGEPMSQHRGVNRPFQGEPLSQQRDLKQPFQGEPSYNIFDVQASYNIDETIHIFGNECHGNCLNWTDEMARLLITAISYVSEAESSELQDGSCSKKMKLISKMKMWKVVSTVMGERGFNVSPEQCEEKFREINNKYKRLISLLGRATSCNVVENPMLLDSINMPENKKHEARKLLRSEQFLYREMCSFHHGNRLFLPHDWEVRRSVFLNLANNCDDHLKNQQGNHTEMGKDQNGSTSLRARWVKTEEKSLEIQEQRLQFEKVRFQWLCLNRNEDLKLEKLRLENETMKLKNAKMAFELKHKQNISVDENY